MIRHFVTLLHWQTQIKKALGIISLLLAILVTIDTVSGQAVPEPAVCDRTPQVRDAIVASISDIDDCENISVKHLNSITGWMRLSNKQIMSIEEGDFNGLINLENLELSYNQLTVLEPNVFNGLNGLKFLTLVDNQLTALDPNVFNGLNSLENLSLGENQLTALDPNFFSEFDLTTLSLRDNQFTALDPNIFSGLNNLSTLELSNNPLISLDPNIFSGLNNLSRLFMHNNQLTALDPDIFSGLDSLHNLYLSNNKLTSLDANIFSGLGNLGQVSLTSNQLTTLPSEIFAGHYRIRQLWLSNNQLTTLPEGVFSDISWLEYLGLENNQLTTLPKGVFFGLTNLIYLDLSGNPGAPFTLMLTLKRTDNTDLTAPGPATIVVELAEGAPFDISVDLLAEEGTLSATTTMIATGETQSEPITVKKNVGSVTVTIGTTPDIPSDYKGIKIVVDEPFVLFTGDSDTPVKNSSIGDNGSPLRIPLRLKSLSMLQMEH